METELNLFLECQLLSSVHFDLLSNVSALFTVSEAFSVQQFLNFNNSRVLKHLFIQPWRSTKHTNATSWIVDPTRCICVKFHYILQAILTYLLLPALEYTALIINICLLLCCCRTRVYNL